MAFKFALYVNAPDQKDNSPRYSDKSYATQAQAEAAGTAAVATLRRWLAGAAFADTQVTYQIVAVPVE